MIKKIIAITIISLSLLAFAMFSALSFVNYNTISSNFINNLKIDLRNISKIKIHKFPIPYLTIDSIQKPGEIELQQIEMQFSLWSLLIFQPKINLVKIMGAKVYLSNKDFDIINHDQLISMFITNNISNVNLNITNLNILNEQNHSLLTLTNYSLVKKPLSNISLFKGNIDVIGAFTGSVEQDKDLVNFHLNIANNDYNFRLSETYKNFKLSHGKGEFFIKNLANAFHYTKSGFNSFFRTFKQNETVNIKFDILSTQDLLQLNNINASSNSFSVNGKIYLAKSDDVTNLIELYFPKIDSRSFFSSNNINQLNNIEHALSSILVNKSVKTNIVIDQIILNDNQILNQINLTSNLEKGVLAIEDLSGIIASGGKFQLKGNITQNSVQNVFDGKIYLQHNDLNSILHTIGCSQATVKYATSFILSSDLKCSLMDIYLQNLSLKMDNINVSGNVTTQLSGSMPNITAVLDFASIDLGRDDYPIISPIIRFAKDLMENMQDDQYLSKFIPIRTITYSGNFDITIHDVISTNSSLGKVHLLANMSPGNIQVSNFEIRTGEDYLSTSWNLIANDLKPQLTIKIEDGAISVNFLKPQSLLSFRNKLLREFSLDKILLKLDCALSKIYQGDLVLENLKLSAENDNKLFILNNLEMDMLLGKFKGIGNILLDPHTINFVYAFNSIDLGKLSAILPRGLLNTYGGASINGRFSTTGDTLKALLYNLNIQSEFIVNNTKINNFSIDSLIEKINVQTYNSIALQNDLTEALSIGQTEVSSLHGNLTLQKGIAMLNNMLFNTQYSTGTASLAVNIYDFNMNLSSIISFYITNRIADLNDTNNQNTLTTLNVQALGNIFIPQKTADSTALQKILDSNTNDNNH